MTSSDLRFTVKLDAFAKTLVFEDRTNYTAAELFSSGLLKITTSTGSVVYKNVGFDSDNYEAPDVINKINGLAEAIDMLLGEDGKILKGDYTVDYKVRVYDNVELAITGVEVIKPTAIIFSSVTSAQVDLLTQTGYLSIASGVNTGEYKIKSYSYSSSILDITLDANLTSHSSTLINFNVPDAHNDYETTKGFPFCYQAPKVAISYVIACTAKTLESSDDTDYRAKINDIWVTPNATVRTHTVSAPLGSGYPVIPDTTDKVRKFTDIWTKIWQTSISSVLTFEVEQWDGAAWLYYYDTVSGSDSADVKCTSCSCDLRTCMSFLYTQWQEALNSNRKLAGKLERDVAAVNMQYAFYLQAERCGADTTPYCEEMAKILKSNNCNCGESEDKGSEPVESDDSQLMGGGGAEILMGVTNPYTNLGADGDMYINTTTSSYYHKINSVWVYKGNIQGNDGVDGDGWTGGVYDAATGIISFSSADGLGFVTGDLRGVGVDGLGWTSGVYNVSTGVVTFVSTDGLGFVTGDLRGSDGLGWTGGVYSPTTGVVSFSSADGLAFVTGDLRGSDGSGVRILGTDTIANILAIASPTDGDMWIVSADYAGSPDRPGGTGGLAGDGIAYFGSAWSNVGAIRGESGIDGKGWTSGNYDASTGKITFNSADGLEFTTDDLRASDGVDGKGWTNGAYDASTGKITFTSIDGLGFVTGDVRGAKGDGWTGGTYSSSTGKASFASADAGMAFETDDLRGGNVVSSDDNNAATISPNDYHIMVNKDQFGRQMGLAAIGLTDADFSGLSLDDAIQLILDNLTAYQEVGDYISTSWTNLYPILGYGVNAAMQFRKIYSADLQILVTTSQGSSVMAYRNIRPSSSADSGWLKMWNEGNDGAGSGLDADTVDGAQLDEIRLTNSNATRTAIVATVDWDNYNITGIYTGNNLANAPQSGTNKWFFVTVTAHDTSYATQVATQFTLAGYKDMYIRGKTAGVWDATWRKLSFTSDLDDYVPYSGASGDVDLNGQDLVNVGNVGIGTTTPSEKLDVYGDIKGDKFIGKLDTKTSTSASYFPIRFDDNNGYTYKTDKLKMQPSSGALKSDSNIEALILKSTMPTGTAPMIIASTTKVANLNADRLDDHHITDIVLKSDVKDNLTSTDTDKPLSANQGKVLNNGKLDKNTAITGATKTKITYGADGLVTGGADANTDDIAEGSTNKYFTETRVKAVKLDDLSAPDDNTDLNASTSKHGLMPKLDGTVTKYLNGNGLFSTPPNDNTTYAVVTNTVNGLAPKTGTPTGKFLKDDKTWAAIPTGSKNMATIFKTVTCAGGGSTDYTITNNSNCGKSSAIKVGLGTDMISSDNHNVPYYGVSDQSIDVTFPSGYTTETKAKFSFDITVERKSLGNTIGSWIVYVNKANGSANESIAVSRVIIENETALIKHNASKSFSGYEIKNGDIFSLRVVHSNVANEDNITVYDATLTIETI